MIALFGVTNLFALRVLAQEAAVAHAETELDRTAKTLRASDRQVRPVIEDLSLDSPPRALLANALLRARVAQRSQDPDDRRRLLDAALAELQAMRGARPYWGEMWSTLAYVQAMRLGPDSPAARNAFDRSYMDAPYLSRAAAWRVGYGFQEWDVLTPTTRNRVLDEAVWLARSSTNALDTILPVARSSPAYEAFMVHWLSARVGDADFSGFEAPTPQQPGEQ